MSVQVAVACIHYTAICHTCYKKLTFGGVDKGGV